jgi:hypothetical protein
MITLPNSGSGPYCGACSSKSRVAWLSNVCSTDSVDDVRRPDWWCYPLACNHGHAWAPGRITVSWMPCDCPSALAERERGAGHLRVSCRAPGCGSVWYKPRHESGPPSRATPGGLELALACDFLIASELARFADTHARMGIMPGWGLTVELPAAVGMRRARQMSATGNFIDAATALTWGLVNHVVPHQELMDITWRLAADAASNDPAAVQAIFATYRQIAQVPGAEALAVERAANRRWHTDGIDRAEVARRRDAVIQRGRTQAS